MAGNTHIITLSVSILTWAACCHLQAAEPSTPSSGEASSDGLIVDRVWPGHPVGFDILTAHGHQFVAYYDAERRMTVAARELGETDWTTVHPEGVELPNRGRPTHVTGWDSHNYLTMALDRKGHLHLSGNMHNDPLIYYRTSRPFDIGSLERVDRMTGEREDNVTYPVFFENSDGELFFRYRDGGSGDGSDLYNIYDADLQRWSRLLDEPLLDGEGQRNAYALDPVLGPDDRFHLVWMWRDTPDAATNHTLSYARSKDLIEWQQCDGTPISLPITLGEGDVVDSADAGEGLINTTYALGFDSGNRPVVVYHRYDENGKSQIYAARPTVDASNWIRTQLSDWDFRWDFGGGGSIIEEVNVNAPKLQPDGSLIVGFDTTRNPGSGRWELDPDTLKPVETLPPAESPLPEGWASAVSDHPGMKVHTVTSRDSGRRWILRWETLPPNRDRPRDDVPPPTELRVFEVSG